MKRNEHSEYCQLLIRICWLVLWFAFISAAVSFWIGSSNIPSLTRNSFVIFQGMIEASKSGELDKVRIYSYVSVCVNCFEISVYMKLIYFYRLLVTFKFGDVTQLVCISAVWGIR